MMMVIIQENAESPNDRNSPRCILWRRYCSSLNKKSVSVLPLISSTILDPGLGGDISDFRFNIMICTDLTWDSLTPLLH